MGENAAPPPPSRRLSWTSWTGRSRRNSESSIPTVLSGIFSMRPGSRSSVSGNSSTRTSVDVARNEFAARFNRAPLPSKTAATVDNPRLPNRGVGGVGGIVGGRAMAEGEAKNNVPLHSQHRRSQSRDSRPPLAFFNNINKGYHQHTTSAAAALQGSYSSHNEEVLLKPPPPRFRGSSVSGPVVDTTTTAVPSRTAPTGGAKDKMPVIMYPPMDNENVARTQRASARVHHVTGAYSTTQAVPRTESRPPITRTNRPPMKEMVTMAYPDDSPPGGRGLERPEPFFRHRSLSNSSVSSSASSILSGRESHDGRLRTVSLNSSQTSIESMPPLHNTPGYTSHRGTPPSYTQYQLQNREYGGQYYSWQKPVAKTYRQKPKPGELFAALPGEVLELILVELRKLHLQAGSDSCATCWMRDCCNIAVSNRKFLKYAREALYQHVYIVGAEGQHMKKRTKLNYGSRLVLLRRTLRANPHMAVIVRSLKPPAQPQGVEAEEYNDLVASVVRACPNLERLVGYYPTYNHSFQRLFHALSTRKRLREMDWVLDASPFQRQHRMRPSNGGSGGGKNNQLWAPGDLQPQQSHAFLELHLNWKYLTTLVVHCEPGATLSPDTLLDRTIRRLPSLENLHISHLPHTSFNDASLLALPPLTKLSLSHLPGITTSGLSSFATRSNTASIHTLTLIHMNVESIPTLARIFANLTSLETFSLVQTYAPNMPSDEFIWLFPYLASHTIRKLHWDIPYLPTRATTADTILAKSVSAGGFPALRILRVPNDPEGLFQALCIPRERIDYATDRYRGGQPHYGRSHSRAASHASYGSRGDSPAAPYNRSANSPTSPLFPPDALMMPRDNSNLHQARLAAQARLESARRFPRFFINVIDEDGVLVEKHGVGAFMGDVRSKIHYLLMPDAFGGTDEGGGLVGVADMLKDGGESLVVTPPQHPQQDSKGEKEKKDEKKRDKKAAAAAEEKTREGCSGRWNTYRGMAVDKKDKERWWHQERGRWRGIILS